MKDKTKVCIFLCQLSPLEIGTAKLTLCDDALHTHHAAQQAGGQGAWGDVLGAEAPLQADEELLVLLGVGAVHRSHQVLQSPLERQQLLERVAHQSEGQEERLDNYVYT